MKMSNEIEIFAGQWKICGDDTFFNGELLIDRKNNHITLKIIKSGEEFLKLYKQIQSTYEIIKKVKHIQGKLFSGEYITLYKFISVHPLIQFNLNTSYMEFNIQVMYAFWGLNIEDNPHLKLEKIKINFGDNLISWYKLHSSSKKNNLIKLPYNEQLTITFYPSTYHGYSWSKREVPLKRDVSVIFEYQSETEWEKILDDILSIQYFIGLGTKQKIQIETIQYKHYILKIDKQYQEDSYDDIILGTGEINTNIDDPEYLFNLQDFNQLNNNFSKWTKPYGKLKPILDLYFAIYKNLPIEIGFLLLMQALETFHARFITDKKTDYTNKVKSIQSNGINHELLYIAENNKKDITLRERISDLCYANGNIPFPQKNYQKLLEKLVKTRNYYTHYNEKQKGKIFAINELPNVIRFLKSLLEYHILTIIGFDDKFIKDTMKDIRQNLNFK